jgi:hypothetical protein
MWKYVIAGAFVGALLGVIGVLLFGVCRLSPWGLPLIALDSSTIIYPLGGIVVGALIGAVAGYGFSDGLY